MANTVDQNFINQYSSMLHMLLQQQGSKLRSVVKVEVANGEKHFFNRIGTVAATEVVTQFQPVSLMDMPHSRRMASCRKYIIPVGIDDNDLARMNLDPTNEYTQTLINSMGKKFDEIVVAAALGTAATGKDGDGSQAFDSNMSIAADGTGLTVAKFNQALKLLEANEVDVRGSHVPVLILPAAGLEDLMGDSLFTSFDYQDTRTLSGTGLPKFRGVDLIVSERVSSKGILMTRDAVKVAMARDLKVEVKDRPDLIDTKQILASMTAGAVRMEEGKVCEINFA